MRHPGTGTAGRVHHGPGWPGHVPDTSTKPVPQNVPVRVPGSDQRWAAYVLPAVAVVILAVTIFLFATAKYWVYYAGEARS